MVKVAPGTLVVYSDIGCPWSHMSVFRLLQARSALGLDGAVRLDHRAFALEVINSRPTPKRILDAEIPVLAELQPEAGWQPWSAPDFQYPVTTLLALEAVQAAKEQGLAASEALDRALREAFFARSRCISLRSVILEVAAGCDVDAEALRQAIDEGRWRRAVIDQTLGADAAGVEGSPHLFLPDGSGEHNPGIEMHEDGEDASRAPVVTSDDPSVYADLLQRAAALTV